MINFLLLMAGIFFVMPVAKGATLVVDPAKSEVNFKAIGKPGFLRINGKGKGLTGKLDPVTGTAHFELPLDSLTTDIDERDRHMKEKYLEVPKYPIAELDAGSLKIKTPGDNEADFKATLKLHGISKEVAGQGSLDCKSETDCNFKGSFSLNLTDFNVDIPSFAGISVAQKVDIEANIAFIAGK